MFFVRFVVLAFLVAYGYGMGREPALNAFGSFIAFSFFITAPALYMLPTFEAWKKGHPNLGAIALVNAFLGWSILGWVVAVVWAYKKPEIALAVPVPPPAAPVAAVATRATKKCPFCAEEVLAEAIKCKHCGSSLQVAG